MTVHRPRVRSDLAEEIERRRGMVPFERYVNELLRLALNASGEERSRQRIEDRTIGTPQATPGHIPPTAMSEPWLSKDPAIPPPQERRVPPVSQTWRR